MKYVFLISFAVMGALSVVACLWTPGGADDGRLEIVWVSDDNPVRREQVDLFNELHPEYRLKLDPLNGGMEKVIVQCLAGVGPDVFDCYNGFQLAAFVRSGIALDCTEELIARGVDVGAIWPCMTPLTVHDGRAYGFPGNAHAPALWFNKRLFDEAGEPYPTSDWTWEECVEIAARMTKKDARGRPVQFGLMVGIDDWMDVLVAQWGGSVYVPEGTRSALDSPEAVEAVQFYRDLIYEYEVVPSPTQENAMASAGGWGMGTIALFGAGKAAMAIGGRWWLCLLRNPDFGEVDLGAVQLPAGPSRRVFGGGRSTLVNARGKNVEGALKFIEYLHGAPFNNLVNRQADALASVREHNYSDEFLFNPEYPEEDYNAVWRAAMEEAAHREVTPYVQGQTVARILLKQGDLIRADLKTPAAAMQDAAREINEAIVELLELDPELRRRYAAAVADGAPKAWDNEEDAP